MYWIKLNKEEYESLPGPPPVLVSRVSTALGRVW